MSSIDLVRATRLLRSAGSGPPVGTSRSDRALAIARLRQALAIRAAGVERAAGSIARGAPSGADEPQASACEGDEPPSESDGDDREAERETDPDAHDLLAERACGNGHGDRRDENVSTDRNERRNARVAQSS